MQQNTKKVRIKFYDWLNDWVRVTFEDKSSNELDADRSICFVEGGLGTVSERRYDVFCATRGVTAVAHLTWGSRSISRVGIITEAVILVWGCNWFMKVGSVRDR